MRQKIKITIPRRLGELIQNPQLDKLTLSIDHYDIELTVVENGIDLPNNQGIVINIKPD